MLRVLHSRRRCDACALHACFAYVLWEITSKSVLRLLAGLVQAICGAACGVVDGNLQMRSHALAHEGSRIHTWTSIINKKPGKYHRTTTAK